MQVRLVGLVLNYLAELYPVDLGRHEPLEFVEDALGLGEYGLQYCAELGAEVLHLVVLVGFGHLLEEEVVLAYMAIERLDALEQRV